MVQYGPGRVSIPVLLYHHVLADASSSGRYAVQLENFISQMDYLHDHGYHAITVSEMESAVNYGKKLPSKPIVITFDDGNRDIYELAFPVLQSIGYPATMYLISVEIEAETNLTLAMISKLANEGWEFGSHTLTHADLLRSNNYINEVCGSKWKIEEITGLTVQSISYPYGLADDIIKQLAKDCGYSSGAGLGLWVTHTSESLFYFSRREVQRDFSLDDFVALLANHK